MDDTTAYVAITRLQAAYADVVTRRAWAELETLFAAEAPIHIDPVTRPAIDLVGPIALGEFIGNAIEKFAFFEFAVLNTVVQVDTAETARARVYIVELRQHRETSEWSNAFGLYEDTCGLDDGRWRFTARQYRSLARS